MSKYLSSGPPYNFLRILHAIITATSLINNTSKMFLSIKHQPETEAERQGRGLQNTIPPPTRFISSSLILHLIRLFSIFTQNYQVIKQRTNMNLNNFRILGILEIIKVLA